MAVFQKHYKHNNKRICGQDQSGRNCTQTMHEVTCKKCIAILKKRGKFNIPWFKKDFVPAPSRLSLVD